MPLSKPPDTLRKGQGLNDSGHQEDKSLPKGVFRPLASLMRVVLHQGLTVHILEHSARSRLRLTYLTRLRTVAKNLVKLLKTAATQGPGGMEA